jgi:N-acetylglucosaminyl-diphospho-decaprenol L-rhamnosyltransferase
MDLSIIIVNWNSANFVRECLLSIIMSPPAADLEIIVVDNASFDGCEAILMKEFSRVKFIQSTENLGFAGANNLASRAATGEFLLFLNPDTLVLPNAIQALYNAAKKLETCGILGAKLFNGDETIQGSCIQSFPTIVNQLADTDFLRRVFPSAHIWGTEALYRNPQENALVDAISGACMLLRRETFDGIGGFSLNYFMYSEDVDLCYKCWLLGLRNYYIPVARIIHYGGGSTKGSETCFFAVLMRESRWRYFVKFKGTPYALVYRGSLGLAAGARIVFAGILGLGAFWSSQRDRYWMSARKWAAIFLWAWFNQHKMATHQAS